MVYRAAWLTDIHLNFLERERVAAFAEELRRLDINSVLIGGDIGEAPNFATYLEELARRIARPIYFVLGNHDFYRGSIAVVRGEARRLSRRRCGITWLPDTDFVELAAGTALVGHDGWADGRAADFLKSEVMFNDYWLIDELASARADERGSAESISFDDAASRQRLLLKLHNLGDEAAEHFTRVLPKAVDRCRHIIVLTHVPPFREACWYQGRPTTDDWAPHLACVAVGCVLRDFMQQRPDRRMTVLCGHTHGGGGAQILENLVVRTGMAKYGEPVVQQVFEWE
jgi:predicted MPP superfamily phosphohydrolase